MPKIIITSGGTRERMDPVRYIGNYSTGKMGKALGDAFAEIGEVKIISGAAEVHYNQPMQRVESARDMLAACEAELPCDIFVACAAVADKRPAHYSENKIKKDQLDVIELIENPDLLATIGKLPPSIPPASGREVKQVLPPVYGGELEGGRLFRPKLVIGFAAESENHIENAQKKLTKKSCDLIVLNDTNAMGEDENEVWLVSKDDEQKLERASKDEIAKQIVEYIQRHCEGA